MTKSPHDLKAHPLIKILPRWPEDSAEARAFRADIREHGILTPLRVTAGGLVVDGWTRCVAARMLGLTEVPVEIVEDGEIATTIMRELALRRNLTKGQIAYLALSLLETVLDEATERRRKGLLQGKIPQISNVSPCAHSVGGRENWPKNQFAGELGLGRTLIEQAQQISNYFQDVTKRGWGAVDVLNSLGHPRGTRLTWREYYEPQILDRDRPLGLGYAITGIRQALDQEARAKDGRPHTGGRPEEAARQLQLFGETFLHDESVRWQYWQNATDKGRRRFFEDLRAHAAELPPTVAEERAEFHGKLAAEFKAAARRAEKQEAA
jgi:hypothetical protein